jgi:hypothetical protein
MSLAYVIIFSEGVVAPSFSHLNIILMMPAAAASALYSSACPGTVHL